MDNQSFRRLFIQRVLCRWLWKSSQNFLLLAYRKFIPRFCLVLHSLLYSFNWIIKNYNAIRMRDVLGAFCSEASPRNLKSDHWFRKLDIMFHDSEGNRCGPVISDRVKCPWNRDFKPTISAGHLPAEIVGLKSHWGHGCLSVVSVVCCQVEDSVTSWSLVQRSPTDYGESLCVI